MRIEPHLYLIGSGQMGFDLTDPYDCNIFLFDSGAGLVAFDAGTGRGIDQILAVCGQDGLDVEGIDHLFLTHAHSDHGGGAAALVERTGARVYASDATARMVVTGDEEAVSLPEARRTGVYPADYRYHPCGVDQRLEDGEQVTIGDLQIELIATPGHSHDHGSYRVTLGGRTYLVAGDAIFHGGRIVLQNTYDCSVPDSIASIEKLAGVEFEALLPGHLAFSLQRGKRHVEAALTVIARMGCPPSLA